MASSMHSRTSRSRSFSIRSSTPRPYPSPLTALRSFLLIVALSTVAALTSPSVAATASSPAVQLASLDARRVLTNTNPRVRPYRIALSIASTKCVETPRRIADMTQRSVEILSDSGRTESRLTILRGLNSSIPRGFGKMRCAEIYAALITLMQRG